MFSTDGNYKVEKSNLNWLKENIERNLNSLACGFSYSLYENCKYFINQINDINLKTSYLERLESFVK